MGGTRIKFGGIELTIPKDWYDVTESLEIDSAPFTLAKDPDGKGALQFSTALYKSGQSPNVSVADLRELFNWFAAKQNLGDSSDLEVIEGKINFVAANFETDGSFLRVWYCSDGKNILLATYICALEKRSAEARESDEIVKSLAFDA